MDKKKRPVGRPSDKKSIDKVALLRLALKNFAERGFGGVTLKHIAVQSDVAVSLLNYHFGTKEITSKEDIWRQAMQLVGSEIQQELDDLFKVIAGLDGLEKLRLFNRKIVINSAKNPEFQQVIVQEMFSKSNRSSWLTNELLKPIYKNMEETIEAEKAKGRIRNIPQANITSFIIGSITMFFSRSYQMEQAYGIDVFSQEAVEAHADAINELIFNGLLVTMRSPKATID